MALKNQKGIQAKSHVRPLSVLSQRTVLLCHACILVFLVHSLTIDYVNVKNILFTIVKDTKESGIWLEEKKNFANKT